MLTCARCGPSASGRTISARAAQNRYPIVCEDEMEEPFEWLIAFRYARQPPESKPLWWRIPKDRRPADFSRELGVAAANILLLYKQLE